MMYGSKDGNIWGWMALRIDGGKEWRHRPAFAVSFWNTPEFLLSNHPATTIFPDTLIFLKKHFMALNWFLMTEKDGF